MSDSIDVQPTYFIRRLTRELAADLVGDAPERAGASSDPEERGWDRLVASVRQAGVAISEVMGSVLFTRKPEGLRQFRPRPGGTVTRNLYGHFLLVRKPDGALEICREVESYTFPKGSVVYIVADLVGMPIARISGVARNSATSIGAGTGQRTNGEYHIDLWLDPGEGKGHELSVDARERLGRFLTRVVGSHDSLTVDELLGMAHQRLAPLIERMLDMPAPGGSWVMGQALPAQATMLAEAIASFQQSASDYLGLTLAVRFRPGDRFFRHSVFLNEEIRQAAQRYAVRDSELVDDNGDWTCGNPDCRALNVPASRFCTECGGGRPSATRQEQADRKWKLLTREGDDLNVEVEYLSFGREAVDTDGIAAACIDALSGECRSLTLADLERPEVLERLNAALNSSLSTGRYGAIGEFRITYFDTAEMEWKRQVRARLREELRAVGERNQRLDVTDATLSLREQQLLRDRQDVEMLASEFNVVLDRARQDAANTLAHEQIDATIDVQRHRMGLDSELEKRRSAAQATGEEMRFTREVELQARAHARDDVVQDDQHRRADEMADLQHEIVKEDKVLTAQRRAVQEAAELQARIDRLKSGAKLDEARELQGIDIDRKRAEQDLDLNAITVKARLEMDKLRMMAEMELLQREQDSRMSSAQLMARQATSMADKGAMEALTQLASHDGKTAEATAEARVAKMQAEMLERMMTMQAQAQASLSESNKEAIAQQMQLMMLAMQQQQASTTAAMQANQEAIKAAMHGQHSANARLQEAQQQTTDAAVAWNARSINAMADVAATKAGNPGAPSPVAATPRSSGGAPHCPECRNPRGGGRFCMECGTKMDG
jgi:hypothetical protein